MGGDDSRTRDLPTFSPHFGHQLKEEKKEETKTGQADLGQTVQFLRPCVVERNDDDATQRVQTCGGTTNIGAVLFGGWGEEKSDLVRHTSG